MDSALKSRRQMPRPVAGAELPAAFKRIGIIGAGAMEIGRAHV